MGLHFETSEKLCKYQNGMGQMGMHVGKVSKKTKTYSAPKTRQYDDDIPF